MKSERVKIFSLGETALTVSFGNDISAELNKKVLSLAFYFDENGFPGLIEIVPAYASLSIFFDVSIVRKHFPEFSTAFAAVKYLAENALRNSAETPEKKSRLITIPVSFAEEYAPDLVLVAAENNLSIQEVVRIFTAETYRVYMLGFLPGFAYMGEVDERIAAPRKSNPRADVSKGSVGIAGRQTGIYSLRSPGGWQIIGKTDVELFTPEADSPTFLRAGDAVRFYRVDIES
ncbi:MAG TPA: 5-oxoprolinase subunit PxpB [Pyrinomonadaceae bacterium]|nr:5-oxoprolinase subunit PxpB [Pyrinomonadaceae bacterium]